MKKNIAIAVMVSLVFYFFSLWQATNMRLKSCKQRIAVMTAERTQSITRQMKTGQENFKWQEFARKAGVEKLLAKSLEGIERERREDIDTEIEKRLLNYPREIYVAEPREVLIKKLLDAGAVGEDHLTRFVKEAKETIRVYEEERIKKWK